MNILFNRPSTPEAAAIRERIFNVLPAASYQMEKLFGLFDIDFSNETETACVECRTTRDSSTNIAGTMENFSFSSCTSSTT
jgi:hypothetical protein